MQLKTNPKHESRRSLHLESLENRMMLSATPLTLTDVQPSGTQAVYWTQEVTLEGGESREFQFATEDLTALNLLCQNENGTLTDAKLGLFQKVTSDSWLMTNIDVSTSNTATFILENLSTETANYNLFVTSSAELETELNGKVTNDSLSETVQTLTFSTISNPSATVLRQSVVLGQLSASDVADCYQFTATGNVANIQLYSASGVALTVEILDNNQNLLATATSVDDFSSVLSSVKTDANTVYNLRVKAASDVSLSQEALYTLTTTENCAVESDTSSQSSLVNTLNASGVGIGKVSGSASAVSETLCQFSGESIRSCAVDGSRMAVVTSAKTSGTLTSVTLHLLEYSGSSWTETASVVYLAGNSDGVDLANFGTAISLAGERVLVGSGQNDSAQIYVRKGTGLESVSLTAGTVSSGDSFGSSVLLTENFAFVSAVHSDLSGTDSGAVCVFQKTVSGWVLRSTLSDVAGSQFGSVLAWDDTLSRLCVSSVESSRLYFYSVSASGAVRSAELDGSASSSNGTVTEFGRAVALEGNMLAVSCKVDGHCRVHLFRWDESANTWTFVTELASQDANVTDFGTALSLSGIQLAVSSIMAQNDELENTGIVYLYRCMTTQDDSSGWNLVQTFQHDQIGAFGKSVTLTRNRLDVWDSLQNGIYSLTSFAAVDQWELNVTETSAVTLTLMTRNANDPLPKLEITTSEGIHLNITPTISTIGTGVSTRSLASWTFTPAQTGTFVFSLYASDDSSASYVLSVASGAYANTLDSGTILFDSSIANAIVVEYAQQILVSSLQNAAASLGGVPLENPELLDGNKVVWYVPKNIANGVWQMTVSGLETVSGETVPLLDTLCPYSGMLFLDWHSVGSASTNIQRGSVSAVLNSANDELQLVIPRKGASLAEIDYAVTSADPSQILSISSPVFDSELDGWVLIVSGTQAGRVTLEAARNALLTDSVADSGLVLESISAAETSILTAATVGTLEAGKSDEISVTLNAGQSANFLLTDDSGNRLRFELFQGETLLASGAATGEVANGQRILGLRNRTDAAVTYTLKITNPAQVSSGETVNYELAVLSGAVWEAERNDSLSGSEVADTPILGSVSSQSTLTLSELDASSLTETQLASFGAKTVISGDRAAIAGTNFVVMYHLENGMWVKTQTITTEGVLMDLALDDDTLALGVNGAVQLFALEGAENTASGTVWTLQTTLERPEVISEDDSSYFGFSVALDGETLVVSAPGANDVDCLFRDCGRVFVYSQNPSAGTWTLQQELTSGVQSLLYYTGYEVGICGDTLAVFSQNSSNDTSILSLWKRLDGRWSESGRFQTQYSSTYFSVPQLKVSENHAVFCLAAGGLVYDYTLPAGSEDWKETVFQTGLQIGSLSLDESGSRLAISGKSQEGSFVLAEYTASVSGSESGSESGFTWQLAKYVQTAASAASLALGESVSLAVFTGSEAPLAQWNRLYDADCFCFMAKSTSADISLTLEDGTDFSSALTLLDSSGNVVSSGALTVGNVYFAVVQPVSVDSDARYVLKIGAAEAIPPSAACVLLDGSEKIVADSGVSAVTLKFSESVDLSSLSASAVQVSNGTETFVASEMKVLGGNCLEFTFESALADGIWTVSFVENALVSISGDSFLLSSDSAKFAVDTIPAEIEDISVDLTAGTISVTFSEMVAGTEFRLIGQSSGEISFAGAELNGAVLTVSLDADALVPDYYTFSVTKIVDGAGNETVPAGQTAPEGTETGSRSFGVVQRADAAAVMVSADDWMRSVLDGAFAFTTTISGYVDSVSPMRFQLALFEGEEISFRFPADGSADGVTASWDAATGCVTISADGTGTLGGTNEQGDALHGATFQLEVLRNTSDETVEAEVNPVTLAEIVTVGETTVRQTTISGSVDSLTETDVYQFTVSGRATISAAVSSLSGNSFKLELYEVLENGSMLFIAESSALSESGSCADTLDSWISPVVNSSRSASNYLLKVTATQLPESLTSGTSGGSETSETDGAYRLVLTENAVFNGSMNGSSETAVTLLDTNTAVGHVSRETSAILSTVARDAMNGHSVVANDRYLFVGVPGDCANGEAAGKVVVFEFDGIRWLEKATLKADDTKAGDQFGTTLVLDGDTLIVSSVDSMNANGSKGAVYVFTLNEDGSFLQTHKITNPGSETSDFGLVMDCSNGLLVTGTQAVNGVSYAFKLNEDGTYAATNLSGIVIELVNRSDEKIWPYLGFSVAVDGDVIALGAPMATSVLASGGTLATNGATFIFRLVQNETTKEEFIQLDNLVCTETSDLRLGYSVTMDDGILVSAAISGEEGTPAVLYTTNLSTIDTKTTISQIVNTSLYGHEVKLDGGILSFSGISSGSTACTLKLNANGVWEIATMAESPNKNSDPAQSSGIRDVLTGFDSAWANSTQFVSDPYGIVGALKTGFVYAFEYQEDFYRFTASDSTLAVTFTGLGSESAGNLSEGVLPVLVGASGNEISGTLENGVWTFQTEVGQEYLLRVAATENTACDYVLKATGIVQTSRLLELDTINLGMVGGGSISGVLSEDSVTFGDTLSAKPASVTFTFSEAVRADRISTASVQFFNGVEKKEADSFTISSDGKTVTFVLDAEQVNFTTEPQLSVCTSDFCTVSGTILDLPNQNDEGIVTFQLHTEGVTISQKLKASETATVLLWQFSEAVQAPSSGWADAVHVKRTKTVLVEGSPQSITEDVTALGTFSYENNVLTWRATEGSCVQTDDQITTTLNVEKVPTVSGLPILNLTTLEDGLCVKGSFLVNLNSAAETQIVIRKTSSLSSVSESASLSTVPTSEKWVNEWNTLWVEVWGRVLSASENGLTTYTAQIAYDSSLFTPLDASKNPVFNWSRTAFDSVTMSSQTIEGNLCVLTLVATTSRQDVGIGGDGTLDGNALIASIQFRPVSSGGVKLKNVDGALGFQETGIGFVQNSITITDTSGVEITGNVEDLTVNLPNVYPVPYDLNEDGSVSIHDLVLFARQFGRDPAKSDLTLFCDFNADGQVSIMDLVLFARNFAKSMSDVTYSTTLTKNWGTRPEESLPEIVMTGSTLTAEGAAAETLGMTVTTLEVAPKNTLETSSERPPETLPETPPGNTIPEQKSTVQTLVSGSPLSGLTLQGSFGNVAWQDWSLLAKVLELDQNYRLREAHATILADSESTVADAIFGTSDWEQSLCTDAASALELTVEGNVLSTRIPGKILDLKKD